MNTPTPNPEDTQLLDQQAAPRALTARERAQLRSLEVNGEADRLHGERVAKLEEEMRQKEGARRSYEFTPEQEGGADNSMLASKLRGSAISLMDGLRCVFPRVERNLRPGSADGHAGGYAGDR